MSKIYLLTGGTGFLGSLLSTSLIKGGNKVVFLGRAKNGESLRQRLKHILLSMAPDVSLDEEDVFETDLGKRFLGLSDDTLKQLSGKIDGIWHLAANLSFKEKHRQEVLATNVGGLTNVLELASRLRTPVYYTSTAYVHGQRPGRIFENELIKPRRFNNVYEESKFKAEELIREWGKKDGNKFIVFRPSILIGKRHRGVNFFGYYAVVYSLYRLKEAMKKEPLKLFLPFFYSRNAFLNLMPVETAVKWMLKIADCREALGKTFHITNPAPFPMKEIIEETFQALNIKMPIGRAPRWFIHLYFSSMYYLSFVIFPLRKLARKFYYYRYYMIEYNVYDMANVKKFCGDDILKEFHFEKNFIRRIAENFVSKMEREQ